jgi:hypothetical protein
MATSTKYHLMRRNGRTVGSTEDAPVYSFGRGDIIEAPSTEFKHLPSGATSKHGSREAAEEARNELGKA